MNDADDQPDGRGADWYERELNPRITVADVPAIVAGWQARAGADAEPAAVLSGIAYGDHPREVFDLFRPANPRGTLVYIHGGYWRAFSQVETSWVADAFLDAGYSVALPTYPLCPEVSLAQIVASIRRAFARIAGEVLDADERRRIVVSGHSAGGHLTAALMATDWMAYGLPAQPYHGAVSVSGVFDLEPLRHTTINEQVRLSLEDAAALSPVRWMPRVEVPMVLGVGALEPGEFHRQSAALAASWAGIPARVVPLDGANHFTAVDSLANPDGVLHRAALDLLGRD